MKSTPPTPPRGTAPATPRSIPAQRPSSAGKSPAELERALALRDVMEHAVRVQREITAPKTIRKSRAGMVTAIALCVPLLGMSVFSWVAKPAAIWGPHAIETSEREDANARFVVFVLAERIESYRQTEGAYPAALAAVGVTDSLVSYRLTSDSTFELQTRAAGRELVFRSSDPVEAFLGNSIGIVTGRKR